MSDLPTKAGPALSDSVEEVRGVFPSDALLQKAIGELTLAGFDRAALSLPTGPATASPTDGAGDPMTDTDVRQARTMGTSMAGTIGAMAAAGATIATGGVAGVAIAAAAAVGVGSALAANAAGNAVEAVQTEGRDGAASVGRLILAVHAPDAVAREKATQIMHAAGATDVGNVVRAAKVQAGAQPAVDSSGWTG